MIVWRTEDRDAAEQEAAVAELVTESARSTAANAIAGLGGSAGLVAADGSVDLSAFAAYQREVAEVSSLDAIAYVPVVPNAERPAFEAQVGRTINDLVGAAFAPAPERERYWPVQVITPASAGDVTSGLIGLDVAKFPLSEDIAHRGRDTGRAFITEAIPLSDGYTLFFILKPLYLPTLEDTTVQSRREAHAGFVVSFYDGDSLGEGIRQELPEGVDFRITDEEHLLTESERPATGGVVRELEVGGRTWTIRVDDRRPVDRSLAWLLIGITALVLLGLAYIIRRSARSERETARSAAMIGRTADLGQHLAGAADADEVALVIAQHVAPIFDADAAVMGLVEGPEGQLRTPGGGAPSGHGPLTDAARTGSMVVSRERDWGPDELSVGIDAELSSRARAAVGLPLRDDDGNVVAAIAVLWARRTSFDPTTMAGLRAVTELCEQTLARARFTDQVAQRAADLAELAQRLAGVTTLVGMSDVITECARTPVGASVASFGIIDREAGVLRAHHGPTVGDEFSQRYANPDLDEPLAFTDAARTGRPIFLPDWESYRQRYPATDPDTVVMGAGARAALPLRGDAGTFGAIVFAWEESQRFDDALRSTLSTIAEIVALTVQRARLVERQVDEARHSRDLAALAQGLSSQADTDDVTSYLASGVLAPLDAAHAAVALVRGDQLVRHYSSPLPRSDRADSLPPTTPLSSSTPLTDAATTGEHVLLANSDELRERYPDLVGSWESAGFAATANLALRDRTGRTFGALGIAWEHPTSFDKELRDRLATIAGMAAQTLERAQLVDQLRVSASRKELLADLAQHLSRGRTADDLLATVATRGGGPVEASAAQLMLIELPAASVGKVPPPGPLAVGSSDPRTGSPTADAVRTQRPVLLTSSEDVAARYPGKVAEAMAAAGLAASAHLPLTSPNGTPLGTIAFGWSEPRAIDPSVMALMRTIGELCAQTLERTRLGEAEHRLVLSLQNRVVTPLPPGKDLSIAQRYRPAASHVGMGGDWFEGIQLDEHRYALVVGDISGHGITAVADMIQLRSIIESLVRAGVPVGEVFPRASALLMANGNDVTASACLAVIDTEADQLSYVAAGHPPPLLRDGTGVTVLESGRQPLLGIPIAPVEPAVVPFPPGSVFAAYTDGLIERRQEMIDTSIERLCTAFGDGPTSDVDVLAGTVMDGCLRGREPDDDVALVLLSHL